METKRKLGTVPVLLKLTETEMFVTWKLQIYLTLCHIL